MAHLREVLHKSVPERGELRRMSNVLRRILVEEDLKRISVPRLGKITITAWGNFSYYKAARAVPYIYFASCGVEFGGIGLRGMELFPGSPPNIETAAHNAYQTIDMSSRQFPGTTSSLLGRSVGNATSGD
jgi:hypothetical protein